MHAAANYDPSRGASFKTFAYTAIRGAILDEIRKHDPVPRNRRDRLRKVDRAVSDLYCKFNRAPTLEELASYLEVTGEELDSDLLALHTSRILSIDDLPPSANGPGTALSASLISEGTSDPGDQVIYKDQVERMAQAISELPETDRHVIVLYHYENLYLKEIGEILGVSESRVSQILSRAIERLRLKLMRGNGDEEE
ncbi:MAG: sigma-70 family RNA polymerase sigma factor, partial [Planctomycetota bacterium]|jgi:RNA polymerase sigma factor for flagellar operon FliA